MRQASSNADHTLAIVTKAYQESFWAMAEAQAAYIQLRDGKSRALIPVRVTPEPMDPYLAQIGYIDLMGPIGWRIFRSTRLVSAFWKRWWTKRW